ncbi:hypothetical protein DFJ58DRAFT_845903 [Suillus subalutaceus]|uniref:uncharacterized protein n=1 Tax=Suillus subalutaceus TaxID=48586 RepID=UPI001B868FBD|nr:uncharacterized protein DFJ58DRAFT_845903 [Suillus subalutaceus]KAG1838861.1 hypothetical protein DFJ58DRAFT_845903 [Suillus subalutaceus]
MVMRTSLALLRLQPCLLLVLPLSLILPLWLVLLLLSSASAKRPYEGTTINSVKTRSFTSTHDSVQPVSTTFVSLPAKKAPSQASTHISQKMSNVVKMSSATQAAKIMPAAAMGMQGTINRLADVFERFIHGRQHAAYTLPPPGPVPEGNMDLVVHATQLLQTEDVNMPPEQQAVLIMVLAPLDEIAPHILQLWKTRQTGKQIMDDVIDHVRGVYINPSHTVFDLVPANLNNYIQQCYEQMGCPIVDCGSAWINEGLDHDGLVVWDFSNNEDDQISNADQCFELAHRMFRGQQKHFTLLGRF